MGGHRGLKPLKLDLPHLSAEPDRYGNDRLYVRRYGRRRRIKEEIGTKEFAEAYAAALTQLNKRAPVVVSGPEPAKPLTLGWLATKYFGSDEFAKLDKVSRANRRQVLESCLQETVKEGSTDAFRDCPLSYITPKKIKRLRDLKKGLPGAANNRRKYLSAMFGWAIEKDHHYVNPVRDVRRVKYASEGFHTWSIAEVHQFADRHPIGSKPRLALSLLLFLGARRGDMVTLGKQHVKDGWITYTPRKTRYKRLTATTKPVLPILADIIAASPTGDLTFLVTDLGRAFTAAGFGAWFRDKCDMANLHHCSAHGLRKAGATIAAENGATTPQLMAIYDWTTTRQAEVYIRAANQKKMAGETMKLLAFGSE